MSKNIQKNLKVLDFLKSTTPKVRAEILKNADNSLVLAICEIALNLYRGNIKCSKSCLRKLIPFKKLLIKLASVKKKKKSKYKKERAHLQQRGGALLPLLLAPVLTNLASYFLEKARSS